MALLDMSPFHVSLKVVCITEMYDLCLMDLSNSPFPGTRWTVRPSKCWGRRDRYAASIGTTDLYRNFFLEPLGLRTQRGACVSQVGGTAIRSWSKKTGVPIIPAPCFAIETILPQQIQTYNSDSRMFCIQLIKYRWETVFHFIPCDWALLLIQFSLWYVHQFSNVTIATKCQMPSVIGSAADRRASDAL